MTTVDVDPALSLRRTLRPDDVSAPAAAESAPPTAPAEAPSTPSPSPATPEQQRASREQAAGAEEARRAAMLRGPVGPAAPRPAVGLRAAEPAQTAQPAPSTPSAATLARVDDLERAGRDGAFARTPEAARAHAAAVAAVLPQVDDPATRRALQRPLDDVAAAAARGAPAARAVVGELAPALSPRGVDALSGALLSAPAGPSGRAARDGLVDALRRTATENVDPLVRQQAAGGILNDTSTVARALSGTHPSLTRGALADLARDRPERVNQLLDVARDLDARGGGAGGIEAALRDGGLARTQLPEVGGVLGGVIDGVESLAAPFVRPVETAQNVAALGAALIADPAGTARAVGGSVVDAVRNDPARAVVGALVGSVGPGNVRRASAAGRVAGDAADAARAARVEGVAARAAAGLGDLRPHEVEGIQRVVNEAQRRMDTVLESVGAQPGELPVDVVVVGSAARGARRNPDTNLPYGTGPGTRSDIDYAIPDPMVREHVFNSRNMSRPDEMFWRSLPGFDTRTVGGMLHHSTPSIDQPRVWFRAGRDPVFLPPGAPNPSLP